MKLTILVIITTFMSLTSYAQQSIAEKHAVQTYFKLQECDSVSQSKDSIIKYQNSQINTFGVYTDSLKFELNNSIVDGKNLEQNAKKAVIYEKKKAALIKELLYVLIPIMVIESLLLIK